MKNLISYCSKYGSTEYVAKKIATKISNFELTPLHKIEHTLDSYETIYLGCPIYYGKMNKSFKQFLKTYKNILLQKDLRLFVLGIDDDNFKNTLSKNIDKDILLHAKVVHVGGAYELEKMSFFDRFITKRVSRFDSSVNLIDDTKILELIKKS